MLVTGRGSPFSRDGIRTGVGSKPTTSNSWARAVNYGRSVNVLFFLLSSAILSQRFAIQFLFNKFDPPVIDGGQIYVPNYNGGVDLCTLAK